MAKLQISVEQDVEYIPQRKTRVFSNKQRVTRPFAKMVSGDSFVIPEQYTLIRVSSAWSRFKSDKAQLKDWGIRSKTLQDGSTRVWLFSGVDLLRYPIVD